MSVLPQPKHRSDCDCGVCAYCNGQEDVWGNRRQFPALKPVNFESGLVGNTGEGGAAVSLLGRATLDNRHHPHCVCGNCPGTGPAATRAVVKDIYAEGVEIGRQLERAELGPRLQAAETASAELHAHFDRSYAAQMRGIKMWQEAHPGQELVWPDVANHMMWLIEEHEKLRARQARFERAYGRDRLYSALKYLNRRVGEHMTADIETFRYYLQGMMALLGHVTDFESEKI